ncbi:PREDICTED: inactive N-acetylated-alpha-linked acidic dipeptidase-like protein 2 [Galeopterus variegatus]|uniref:Inactive N-acetylated-alpha-linked acidic dipeptidase-like protein 2 n=1 Tax=Galeopterus variegatus TaxID=482537 RepID=A0ABM0SIE8_GALVR|nr:PREDICTED: inactive N-acetylated-alpha-linked acidic dipeptidase-like protein 2 [Galeopterus variegatus]
MAYQKVSADQRAPGHSQYLDNDDLQATALDLEWDMEKELEEPGFDQFQLDSTENQNLGHSETADLNLDSIQRATSPKGRFQRLQEESDYVAHYQRSAPKSIRCNFCYLLKIFCTATILFIFGILIGYYAHKNHPSDATSSGTVDPQLYQEILKTIQAEDIKKSFSSSEKADEYDYFVNGTSETLKENILGWHGPKSHSTEQLKNGTLGSLPSASANITWAILPNSTEDEATLTEPEQLPWVNCKPMNEDSPISIEMGVILTSSGRNSNRPIKMMPVEMMGAVTIYHVAPLNNGFVVWLVLIQAPATHARLLHATQPGQDLGGSGKAPAGSVLQLGFRLQRVVSLPCQGGGATLADPDDQPGSDRLRGPSSALLAQLS